MSTLDIEQLQEDARKWQEYQKSLEPVERMTLAEELRVDAVMEFEKQQEKLGLAQKPTPGRIVMYTFPLPFQGHYATPKGQSQTVPAIITNVFTETIVNLTVFIDGDCKPMAVSSVNLKKTGDFGMVDARAGNYWEWPPRV